MAIAYFNVNGGSGYTSPLYYTSGKWYKDSAFTEYASAVNPLPVPVTGYKFLGYYSASSSGTKYTNEDGELLVAFTTLTPTSDFTCYAQYERELWTVTLDKNGGDTSGQGGIYYKIDGGGFYTDTDLTDPVTRIILPTKSMATFLGYYSAASGGTQYIDADGYITDTFAAMTLTADTTLYAHWQDRSVYCCTLNKGVGSGGTEKLYKKKSVSTIYADEECTTAITTVTTPSKDGRTFLGYYNTSTGSTQYISAAGAIQSRLASYLSADRTIYAKYSVQYYVLTLNLNGGFGTTAIYYKPSTGWFSDTALTNQITSITPPTRSGYAFAGFSGYISADGTITKSSISNDVTATASWTAQTYTLGFDYKDGTPVGSVVASIQVTSGSAVGTLPGVTKTGYDFVGWQVFGTIITAETVWNFGSGGTATPKFSNTSFGIVTDYFDLDGRNGLVLESSDSGDTHQHACAYNATGESPATETGGIWRNPRCTYRATADATLNFTLGAAFAGVTSGTSTTSTVTRSGYMISSVEIHTAIGEAPTVTVTGVANEGHVWVKDSAGTITSLSAVATPAVQTYSVSVAVSRRHRAQNLMSAISGGGQLQSLTLVARGDPVVVAENGMPCASDLTHGHIEVTATTGAYQKESAPTAGTGFVKTAEPVSQAGTAYKTWNVTVRKELV